jgi:hypothetical protein
MAPVALEVMVTSCEDSTHGNRVGAGISSQANSATAEEYCIMTTELGALNNAAAMQGMQPQMSRNHRGRADSQ